MGIFVAVVLGAVQGLTEFLPVSSSGHLVLLQKVFGISEPALFFDTMVHVGTLAAVFAALWRDIWAILRRIVQPLTAYLILATVPAVVFALIFKDSIEKAFESGKMLGAAFLITSALLAVSEILSRRAGRAERKKAGEMTWRDALIVGLLQAAAIIPGVSRSGATLSGALSRRLDRDFAARFSFLLSIPAILGALVLQLKNPADAAGGIGAAPIIAGTLSAAIVGFFAVRLMLKIVKNRPLAGFAIYTAILGALVLIDQFVTHLVF
ncbi:MAG: undecaprenyl-diphosphate phosphatase [Treponema sp.]|jgi:undecaprenyl-diphosphatase|nr:undecaprenyl-diphosphate phosphatase [Treponema sp.]